MLGIFKGILGSYIEKGFFGEKLKEYLIGDGFFLYNVNFILEMYEEVRNKVVENRKLISNRELIYS